MKALLSLRGGIADEAIQSVRNGLPRSLRSLAMTVFHLTLITLFSYLAFTHIQGRLFIGNDGPMLLALAKEQLEFFGVSLNLHSNVLQGIGNLSFPMNLSAVPGHWLPLYDSAGNFTPAATYTWFAVLMFITVLLVGWNYKFPRGVTYIAAWLLTILMFPFVEFYLRIYAVTASSPIFIIYMFAVAVADIGVQRLGKHYIYTLPLLLGILIVLAISPAAMMLIAPFLMVSFAVNFMHTDALTRKRQLIAAAAVLLVCVILGWVEYVAGLLLYSSSGFYFSELVDSYSNAREFASILFQGHVKDRAFGPWLFGLATIGAIWALYRKDNVLKKPAIIMLCGQVLHAGMAAQFLAWSDGWTGPPPIYFEMTFFMLYALFAVYVCAQLLSRAWQLRVLGVAVALLISAVFLFSPAEKSRNLLNSFAMPPAETALVKVLKEKIGLNINAPFNGRVATVLPATLNGQVMYSYRHNITHYNDHMTDGLWLFNIPTLTEYNQLITPAFYRITRHFLTLPNDKQNRSWTSFSYTDQKILRMLGVRFLLSTDAQMEGATRHTEIPAINVKPLYLFELADANTQGISAHHIISVNNVAQAEEAMSKKEFDVNTAVIFSPLEGVFVPADTSSITIEKGGYRIRAESAGRTLLMLPIEYSHCSEIIVQSGEKPEIQRVNIALTGLVFEKKLDILLSTGIGPFHQPRCRMKDYREFRKLL